MINIKNLSVSYGDQKILNNINVQFPRHGLYSICGPSGCGKSTFLNCLSGLIGFKGIIELNGLDISHLNDNEKDSLRLFNYGFVFQDFKLFENETVEENILFPLRMVSNDKEENINRKCDDLLSIVDLKEKRKSNVNLLSGGQKQRVSIARALVNDPKIVLADEPTGALDTNTAISIMKLLKHISKRVLVIIVTHDFDLAKQYSDFILKMKDGNIESVTEYESIEDKESLPIYRNEISIKKPKIPLSFLVSHSFNSIKIKKGRSILCGLVTSLGLIGFGASIVLTENISKNIKSSYSNLLEQDRITISLKNEAPSTYETTSINQETMYEIAQKYKDYVDGIGVIYLSNFEEFFPDSNSFYLVDSSNKKSLDGLTARSINEFKWINDNQDIIYPKEIKELEDDEVILSTNYSLIQEICWQLRIERTVESLSNYLLSSPIYIYLDAANYNWTYTDQQILKIVGFTLNTTIGFIHSNNLWNEYMYESRMRFPISFSINSVEQYPWIMKKAYYFKTKNYNDSYNLIKNVRNDKTFKRVILEIANKNVYPNLLRNVEIENSNRLIAYENNYSNIPLSYIPYFEMISSDISCPIFGCNNGYSIYPSNLMSGFSSNMYFSFSEETMTKVLDANSSLAIDDNEFSSLPSDILSGHFAKSLQNSVKFSVFNGNLLSGTAPNSINEIAISNGMFKELMGDESLDKPLLISYTSLENITDGKKTYREFITKQLKVTGIVDDDKYNIYQESFWTIGFFQCFFGVSAYNLNVNTISYKVNDSKNIEQTVKILQKKFPEFEVLNPFDDVNSSVDEICSWIEVALTIFSGISIVTSVLLLSICNYLHILDNKKDIALARCIGATKNESKKFIYSHSLIMCLISFTLSSAELIIASLMTSLVLAKTLSVDFSFSFNPLSLLLMLTLCILISLFSSFFMSSKISKIEPLEALK